MLKKACFIFFICTLLGANMGIVNAGDPSIVFPTYKEVETIVHKGKPINFKQNVMAASAIARFNVNQVRTLKNTIFARHNYQFNSKELTAYFKENYPNYKPLTKKVTLTEVDKVNLWYLKRQIKWISEE